MSATTIHLEPAPPLTSVRVVPPQPRRSLARRAAWAVAAAIDWTLGLFAAIVGLAILASIPVLQVFSLGYLLEVSGRIGRTGKLRSGFIGMRRLSRLGGVVVAVWVLLLAPRMLASLWADALLIAGNESAARTLRFFTCLSVAWVVLHVAGALWQGGRWRHFAWPRPIRFLREASRPEGWRALRSAVTNQTVGMRLWYYFSLGLRGVIGATIWLVLPTLLLIGADTRPWLGFVGGLWMAAVALLLPIALARMATSNRLRDVLAIGPIWENYLRAPIATFLAVAATLLMAVPLYLLKIEMIPREALWLPSVLFVISIWPSRILAGWAVHRARQAERRWWRTGMFATSAPALAALGLAYVLILYLTQFLSWYGIWSLMEQHAFLLPVPFLEY